MAAAAGVAEEAVGVAEAEAAAVGQWHVAAVVPDLLACPTPVLARVDAAYEFERRNDVACVAVVAANVSVLSRVGLVVRVGFAVRLVANRHLFLRGGKRLFQ